MSATKKSASQFATLRACQEIAASALDDFGDLYERPGSTALAWAQWCRNMAEAALESDDARIAELVRQRDGLQ